MGLCVCVCVMCVCVRGCHYVQGRCCFGCCINVVVRVRVRYTEDQHSERVRTSLLLPLLHVRRGMGWGGGRERLGEEREREIERERVGYIERKRHVALA